jgi:hypothetical protein
MGQGTVQRSSGPIFIAQGKSGPFLKFELNLRAPFLNWVSAFHTLALRSLALGQCDRHTMTTTLPRRGYGVCDASMHTPA